MTVTGASLWLAAVVAGAAVLVTGCNDDGEPPLTYPSVDQGRVELPPGENIYRAGANLDAGVYTSGSRAFCDAVVTRTRSFKYDDENPAGVLLREAVAVWNVRRILVRDGEYLHTYGCKDEGWQLQDPAHPVTPDPATLDGGCEILFGRDRVVDRVLGLQENPFPGGPLPERRLPEALEALGATGNQALGADSRTLANVVYHPKKARGEDGELLPPYADALARLREACGK